MVRYRTFLDISEGGGGGKEEEEEETGIRYRNERIALESKSRTDRVSVTV